MKLLFVCSRNRLRSPTAEAIFGAYEGVEVSSAGTGPDAETSISSDLIDWADIIFTMEDAHKTKLNERFRASLKEKKVIVLRIRDKYSYMQPELIEILKAKVLPHLKK